MESYVESLISLLVVVYGFPSNNPTRLEAELEVVMLEADSCLLVVGTKASPVMTHVPCCDIPCTIRKLFKISISTNQCFQVTLHV